MLKANPDRALADLYHLRSIGTYKTGVHRPTLSPEDMLTRHWLVEQLQGIGHEAGIDGIANVWSRAPGTGPFVLAGSHIESQNHAGWLDGALGVVYALEAARAVHEAGLTGGVDVMAFADEEGHFAGGFPGSESFVGELTEERIDALQDRSGRGSLRDMLSMNGLAGRERVRIEPNRYRAFFEAHIEQGSRLIDEGFQIGVVTSIVAIWQYRLVFEGAQNHAGTTTMGSRRDAAAALQRVWQGIQSSFPDLAGPHSVWTVGRIDLDPGGPSIIPGRAEMLFQFRDADQTVLDRLHDRLEALVAEEDRVGPCSARLEIMSQSRPAHMAATPQAALKEAADALAPGQALVMPSGAGHDAQVIAPHVPSAMMFVPSIGGISHHWTEDTSDEDIKLGVEVYCDAVRRVLMT